METVLFIVHVEEGFRKYFTEGMLPAIRKEARKADRVIVMESLIDRDFYVVEELEGLFDTKIEWAWGYEPYQFVEDKTEFKWIIPTLSPHEWTWVPPEIRNMAPYLRHANVVICGGCNSECLQDFRDVLEFMEIEYSTLTRGVY